MGRLADMLIGLNDLGEILRAIKTYTFSKSFAAYCQAEATKMVTHLFTDAGRTWRQAARYNSRGKEMYLALRKEMQGPLGGVVHHQIQRNAELIKSMPLDIAKQLNVHVLNEAMKGTRSSDIAEQILQMFPHVSEKKANLIARTETSKTSTALTQARCELMGTDWYIWQTSQDVRVRDSHKIMSGVLIRWSDPPSPEQLDGMRRTYGHYHAGDIFNCRCYPEPVIDLDLVKWPAKVYHGGRIQTMTRKQFERFM